MTKSAICVWDFTLKSESVEFDEFRAFLREHCKKYTFQKERGASGYEHFQGRVSLKVKNRKGPDWTNIHWSPTSEENKDNMFYVMKSDTRIDGPWTDKDGYIPRQARNITLYPWQNDILENAGVWDTRTINVVVCPKGNIGKSTLTCYAGSRGLARTLPVMDSYKDYMRMVMDTEKCRLYLIDFPRSMNKNGCNGFWSAIECLKNGYAYDDRYNFREEWFDCPNIWVFTNSFPDTSYLSDDRWKFWEVGGDRQLRRTAFCNNIKSPEQLEHISGEPEKTAFDLLMEAEASIPKHTSGAGAPEP